MTAGSPVLLFSQSWTNSCSIQGCNSCFLTCIQISQETGKMVWYFHLLKSFPHFVMIHTVKEFSVVDETEVMFFLKFSCFFCDPMDVGNLISGSSAFSKHSLKVWKLLVCVMLKSSSQNFKHDLTSMGDECNSRTVWTFFSTALLGNWNADLCQSCGHWWVFQICWHIECSTCTASSFRIWNSWTEILSPLLDLFVVMFSKAHLTLDSKMSGSKLVITSSWLSGSWRSFLYHSSVYSCHLY